MVSLAGDWFSFVAVASLVTELTGRPGASAFVYAATVLPVFVASPIAGIVADRFDRKRILVLADLARVPIALLLCLAAWWSSATLAIAAVIALAIGASFSDPCMKAATPNLVDPDELATAQALMGAVWGSMLMVGAGIGGLVAELLGRQAAFAIDATSFLASAWLVAGIRRPMQLASTAARAPEGLGDALRYLRAHPLVLRLVASKVAPSSANGIVGLLPTFATHRFAGTNIATGLLFAARGLGAMTGPILASLAVGATPGRRAVVAVCSIASLAYCVVYAVLPFAGVFGVALVLVFLAHLGGGAQWSMSTYGLQTETPDHVRGRIMAIDYGLATLAIGISAVLAGLLADAFGEGAATWSLTAIGGVCSVAWTVWSLATLRRAR